MKSSFFRASAKLISKFFTELYRALYALFRARPLLTSVAFIIVIAAISIPVSLKRRREIAEELHTQTELIAEKIRIIDERCHIIGARKEKLDIDFLNVESFTGNEVGGLILEHPENWPGALMEENLHPRSGGMYQLVFAQDGIFVLPGDGTLLPGGKVVGKGIKVPKKKPLGKLLESGGEFNYRGLSLGTKVSERRIEA